MGRRRRFLNVALAAIAGGAVAVNFTSGGVLTQLTVAPGQKVTRGQVLAAVDDTDLGATLTNAPSNLAGVGRQGGAGAGAPGQRPGRAGRQAPGPGPEAGRRRPHPEPGA